MTNMQKITLASSRDIPFNNLVLSQSNVRRVKAGISVDELAESIARRGLIQSLHVRPVIGEDGAETGKFEVPAGGRRFRALELLVKQKRLAKTAPVPCIVSAADDGVLIDEVSLAENIERAPLHPLDQFRAFQAMREKGMTEEAIAAAFFVDVKVVKQRLRLVYGRARAAGGLCRRWHDPGTADGLHDLGRSRSAGAGLGGRQELLVEGALPDPSHADRDRRARVGQARPLPGARRL